MCAVGFSVGSSVSDPYGTRILPSRPVQYSSEKHSLQRVAWWLWASPMSINESAPSVTLNFSGSISPQGKKAEPVVARQFEQ
jgi:hypothetical protein